MEAEVAKWQNAGILDMFGSARLENGRLSIELKAKDTLLAPFQPRQTPLHFCRQSTLMFDAAFGSTLDRGVSLFTFTPVNGSIIAQTWLFEPGNSTSIFCAATCFHRWGEPHLPDCHRQKLEAGTLN